MVDNPVQRDGHQRIGYGGTVGGEGERKGNGEVEVVN